MLEIFNHILGIFINIFLICKVVARPLLWSTINTFFCSLFCLNAFHLLLQLFLIIMEIRPEKEEAFLQALDFLFIDIRKSKICSSRFLAGYIFRLSTLNILGGVHMIRFLLIRYAERIRTRSMARKTHQARLSTLGKIMSVYILAYFVMVTCNLVLMPKFPDSYVLVIHCRGLQLSYTPEEQQKITRGQMIRMTILICPYQEYLSCY